MQTASQVSPPSVTPPSTNDSTETLDGRHQRRVRSRAAVIDATFALITDGDPMPTAQRVANKAQVSVRLVFDLFKDLDSLVLEVANKQWERIAPLLETVDTTLPFDDRLAQFVERRTQLYEAITPVRRAVLLREPFLPEVATIAQTARNFKQEQTRTVFAKELASISESDRAASIAAVCGASSWSYWDTLRNQQNLSAQEATSAMKFAIERLLKCAKLFLICDQVVNLTCS